MTPRPDRLTAADQHILDLIGDQPDPVPTPPLEDRVSALEVTVDTIQQDLGETATKA